MLRSWRRLCASAIALALPAVGLAAGPAHADETGFLVGRGVADITGEPGEVGFMGYGSGSQKGTVSAQFQGGPSQRQPASR